MTDFSSQLALDVEKIKLEILHRFHWRAFVHYSVSFYLSLPFIISVADGFFQRYERHYLFV